MEVSISMLQKIKLIYRSISKQIKIVISICIVSGFIYIWSKHGLSYIYKNPVNLVFSIVSGLIVFFGVYEGIIAFMERNYIKINPETTSVKEFVDRTEELQNLINLLKEGKNINIFGQSGIGKTYLGKQLVSILNNEKNLPYNYQKMRSSTNTLAFYIPNNSNNSLEFEFISAINIALENKEVKKINDILNLFNNNGTKQIIIVFDAIKKGAFIRKEVEDLISKLSIKKLLFVIISEEPVHYSRINAQNFSIGDKLFTVVEIQEMIEFINSNQIDETKKINVDVESVAKISSGLPVMIDLILQNSHHENHLSEKNEYFFNLLESIWEEDQYYLFRDLIVRCIHNGVTTLPSSYSKHDLNNLIDKHFINYNFKTNQVNIHKLVEQKFHQVFNSRDKEEYQLLHKKQYELFSDSDHSKAVAHLLCTDYNTINVASSFVIDTYDSLFTSDSYDELSNNFLLFDNLTDRKLVNKEISTYITYGNLYSLMGVGRYKEANNFFESLTIDYAPLSVNQAVTKMDYQFLFRKADLAHLVNDFTSTLEDIELLMNSIENSKLSEETINVFTFDCLLLKAHVLGHKGENLFEVKQEYTNLLSQVEKFYLTQGTIYSTILIKTIYGLICSHLSMHTSKKLFPYEEKFSYINKIIKTDKSKLEHLYYRVNRHYSMYLRQEGKFKESEKALKESINYFKEHSHRIIYDFYFSLADLYREQKKFEEAIDLYKTSESYAKEISDTNLYIYSRLGIIICLIQKNDSIKDDYIVELKQLLAKSTDSNMYVHSLHLRIFLYALLKQQEIQKPKIIEELNYRGLRYEKNLIEKSWTISNLNQLQFIVR